MNDNISSEKPDEKCNNQIEINDKKKSYYIACYIKVTHDASNTQDLYIKPNLTFDEAVQQTYKNLVKYSLRRYDKKKLRKAMKKKKRIKIIVYDDREELYFIKKQNKNPICFDIHEYDIEIYDNVNELDYDE